MRVLIAEDDPISRRVLETMLTRWGYEITVACDGTEAWDFLSEADSPRLAILDWMMPGRSGVEVCRLLREAEEEDRYHYVILLTAKGRQEDIIEGMNAGADDYITKPFDSGELKVRLGAAKRILDLQTQLIAAREALREQATHDSLTGLWNRAAILAMLNGEINRSAREQRSVGVIMVDVDNFKSINDTFGHKAGDLVLAEAARRMVSTTRPYDRIGRYGGEEFLIVVPGCDLNSARSAAERIRADLAAEPITISEQVSVSMTVSIGVSSTVGGEECEAATLVYLADEALYRAKNAGRNRVELTQSFDFEPASATP